MPNPIIGVFSDIPQSSETSAGSSAAQNTQRYKEIEQIAKYNRENNTNFYTLAQIQEHQKKLQELEQAKAVAFNPDPEDVRDAYISALNPQTTKDVDKIRKWDKNAATTNGIGLAVAGTIPEMATFGIVPGLARYGLGLVTGHYGSQAGTAAGGWLDDKLGTKVFSPALGFVGGLAGYGMGADMATGIGRIPLWKTYKPLSTNAPQLTGHFGQVKYYGPTMGKTTAAKSNPKIVDFDDIIRQPSRSILDRFGFKNKAEMYNSGNQEAIKAYEDMLVKSLRDWRANPENSNLTLVASPTAIANPIKTGFYFDNIPSIPSRSVFIARNVGRGGTPEASAMWYDSLMEKNPNLKIDNRFVSEIEKQAYITPNTGYKSIFMEEPIMGRGPGRPKKSSTEVPISSEAWDEMLFEDLIGEQGAINAARKASQAGKRVLKPITEAEKLGIPKSLRSDARALEDPYYWGYRQWNQRYNDAIKAGNMEEAQRLRDLHFKIKTPDNKLVDYKGNAHKVYHGSPEDWYIFDDSKRGADDVIYFSTDKAYADQYTVPRNQWQKGMIPTRDSREFYLYGKKPINVGSDMYYGSVQDELIHNWANGLNADSVYGLDAITNYLNQSSGMEFGVLRRNQLKLTNPITRTKTGEIIPIVKRDNFHNPDIRYKQGGKIKSIVKIQKGVPEIDGGELDPVVVKPKPVRIILQTDPITKNTPITHSSLTVPSVSKKDLGFFISKDSDDATYNLFTANCSDATGKCLQDITGVDFTSGITTPIGVSRKARSIFGNQSGYTESGGGLFKPRIQSFEVPWYDYRKAKDLYNERFLNSLIKKWRTDGTTWSEEREDAIRKNWWEQNPKLKYYLDENNNVIKNPQQ